MAAAPAEVIRSRQNGRLKDLRRRLLRPNGAEDGLIPVEGEHLIQEAMSSGLHIDTLFLREDRAVQGDRLTSGNPLTFVVAANAFNHACATESPQGVAALIKAPKWSLDALLQVANPVLLVLAALQDPGNVGTIIRSAEAFGVTGILLTPGMVHPWNQKVLRASAGSSFRLPVIPLQEDASLEQLRTKGIPLYAASAQAKVSVVDATLKPPVAFVIGNEGAGISKDILAYCSSAIHIPYSGPVESLNAAVAASILLYEVSRQFVRAVARSGI